MNKLFREALSPRSNNYRPRQARRPDRCLTAIGVNFRPIPPISPLHGEDVLVVTLHSWQN